MTKAKTVPMLLMVLSLILVAGAPAAQAQTSASYTLTEHTFNAGGHPAGGASPTSTSYRLSLDAVGDAMTKRGLSSPSYRMDGSFAVAYRPPGEVTGLRLPDLSTLEWDPEASVGTYNLYSGPLTGLGSGDYGTCHESAITGTSTTDTTDPPAAGECRFYLVTAENRLAEEGTMGRSSEQERLNNNPCP